MKNKEFLGVSVSTQIAASVKRIAAEEVRSVSSMVEFFLREGVRHRNEQKQPRKRRVA